VSPRVRTIYILVNERTTTLILLTETVGKAYKTISFSAIPQQGSRFHFDDESNNTMNRSRAEIFSLLAVTAIVTVVLVHQPAAVRCANNGGIYPAQQQPQLQQRQAQTFTAPSGYYVSTYDHIDVGRLLRNDRVVAGFVKCFTNEGPCSGELRDVKGRYEGYEGSAAVSYIIFTITSGVGDLLRTHTKKNTFEICYRNRLIEDTILFSFGKTRIVGTYVV